MSNPTESTASLKTFIPALRAQGINILDIRDSDAVAELKDGNQYSVVSLVDRTEQPEILTEAGRAILIEFASFIHWSEGATVADKAELAQYKLTVAPALRLGSGTGSLMNHVMSGSANLAPEVGMGATILFWSDRHAATITEVAANGKRVGIVEDIATRTDENGMSDAQTYSYAPGTGKPSFFTLRKNGAWVREGESMKDGQRLRIGERDAHHDYSF